MDSQVSAKTKKLIAYGLIELLNDYKYDEINITMISQEAGISRRTFYRHFTDKDEIIKHMYHLLFDKRIEKIYETNITYEESIIPFFNIFYDNRMILKKLLINDKHEILRRELKEVIELYNTRNKPLLMSESTLLFDYYNDYHSSAIFSILSTWILKDCKEETSEIVDIYLKILHSDW